MLTPSRKKIEKKLHPCDENALMKASLRQLPLSDELKVKMMMKYAPRFSRTLLLTPCREARLMTAFKRIKKVDNVTEGDLNNLIKNQWRLILQNKFKSIQIFNHPKGTSSHERIQKNKAFLNVKKVLLDLSGNRWDQKKKFIARSLLCYLPSMSKIKAVDLKVDCDTDPVLIIKLNSMSKLLSSLKALQVVYRETIYKDDRPSNALESILEQCKDLSYLSLDLDQTKMPAKNYLKNLKNFEKLEVFEIIAGEDIFESLQNFAPPSSIKVITIQGVSGPWSKAYDRFYPDGQCNPDILRNDERLAPFFERWRALKNLVSLNFIAKHDFWETSHIVIFAKALVESLENLENFHLEFVCTPGKCGGFPNYMDQDIYIDLSRLFGAFSDFSGIVRKLKLSFTSPGFTVTCNAIPEDIHFPQFTEIDLKDCSIQKIPENIFDAVRKFKAPEKTVKLLMNEWVHQNYYLFDFLQNLQQIPKNCFLEIDVMVRNLDLKSLDVDLKEFIRESKVVRNASLKIKASDIAYLNALSSLSEMFMGNVCFQKVEMADDMYEEDIQEYEQNDLEQNLEVGEDSHGNDLNGVDFEGNGDEARDY